MSTLDDTAAGHSAPKRRFFLGFLLATACVLPAVAWADPLPDVASFTVRIIEASQEAVPHQDPGLEPIHTELKNFQHSYNQFKIVRSEVLKLKVNDRGVVKLPDGKEFAIALLGFVAGGVDRVRHRVEMPGTQSTRLMAYGGRTLDVLPSGAKATIIWTALEKR
jgi:hypothetical protein